MNAGDREAGSNRPRRRVRVAVVVVSVLAAPLLLDAYFGCRAPHNVVPDQRRYVLLREHDPGGEWSATPPPAYTKYTDTLELREYAMRIDDNGFIRPSRIHDDPDYEVVFLGGSTTECAFLDEDVRFPVLVGENLAASRGKVNSYNGAHSGNNSLHSLDILLNKVVPMQPDSVVLMHNVNDLTALLYEGTYWIEGALNQGVIAEVKTRHGFGELLGMLVQRAVPHLYHRIFVPALPMERGSDVRELPSADRIREIFGASLTTFVHICRSWHITPVLMTQQNRLTDTPDPVITDYIAKLQRKTGLEYTEYITLYGMMNQTIRDVGRELAVTVIDLDAVIPKDKGHMHDVCHLTERGSRLAAEVIAAELAKGKD